MRPAPLRLTARSTQRIGQGQTKVADPYLKTKTHKDWAAAVMQRAGYRCEWIEGGKRCPVAFPPYRLYAHHVVERRDDMSKAADPSNGKCICARHHTLVTNMARAKRLSQ